MLDKLLGTQRGTKVRSALQSDPDLSVDEHLFCFVQERSFVISHVLEALRIRIRTYVYTSDMQCMMSLTSQCVAQGVLLAIALRVWDIYCQR